MESRFVRALLQGRIGDHPIHPLLVHIPVGLFVASLIFDIVFLTGGSLVLPSVSFYCIALAWIGGVFAALSGLVEYRYVPRETEAKRVATLHFLLNAVVLVLYVPNFVVRSRAINDIPTAAFALSILGVGILAASGYLGGKLAYFYGMGRHPAMRATKAEILEHERKKEFKRVA